jgi:hypothetical protein
MIIYCILNPDAKFPFYLDAKLAREQWAGRGRFDILKFVDDKIRQKQKPMRSSKYSTLREKQELQMLSEVYERCTTFDPPQRLSVTQVVSCFNNHLDVVPLPVSQNSALERYDWFFAAGLASSEENLVIENAVNACSFLSVVLGDLILSSVINIHDLKADVISHAEHSITEFPRYFNQYRNSDQLYDAQEAYNILRRAGVVTNNYELTEEVLTPHCVFSEYGKKDFSDAMSKLLSEVQNSSKDVSVAIYTCGEYVLLIGCMEDKIFLVDTHPVVKDDRGNQTGAALFSDGHPMQSFFIYEWLTGRLKKSGVAAESMQSFAILK